MVADKSLSSSLMTTCNVNYNGLLLTDFDCLFAYLVTYSYDMLLDRAFIMTETAIQYSFDIIHTSQTLIVARISIIVHGAISIMKLIVGSHVPSRPD